MIRPFFPSDTQSVINLLRLNTPVSFDKSEEKELISYLENEIEDYFVAEINQQIVGAGGINIHSDLARISWDIIHPDFQGKGIGRLLTQYRIDLIKRNPIIKFIEVRTSQLAYRFYEKMGFKLESITKDYWAKGYDLYSMKLIML